jgi:hypothetical protein
MRKSMLCTAFAVATILAAPLHAAPCAGFTDVVDTSSFCPNVEWLKNRGVTTGCTASTYCPADAVNRIAMAAFLRRLGDALTPLHVKTFSSGNSLNIDLNPVVCPTPVANSTITGAPRKAHGLAVLNAVQTASAMDLAARFVESTDGGVSWVPVSPDQAMTTTGQDRPTINVLLPPRDLLVGSSYRYALRLSRAPGGSTGGLGNWNCSMRVTWENRNSATSPFDEEEDVVSLNALRE